MDGDQVSVRGIFSDEANKEIEDYTNSKLFYINFTGKNSRIATKEAIQCFYNFTLVLPDDRSILTEPKF